jgi:hypothetical protein
LGTEPFDRSTGAQTLNLKPGKHQLSKMQHDEKFVAETTAKTSGSSDGGEHGVVPVEFVAHTKQTYTLKMDLRLIPILGCTYTILFLDRTNSE